MFVMENDGKIVKEFVKIVVKVTFFLKSEKISEPMQKRF